MCSSDLDKMAKYQELLTPLPPNASLEDIERRRALLVEQATKITERELYLTNKETEFIRKQREKGADDVFRPARDKNLHKKLDFHSKWEADHVNSVWRKYHHRRDPVTNLCYFNTPAKNMEAAQGVMFDKSLNHDARLKYSAYLLEVAQQQQNDSQVKSGRLVDDSRLCKSTANKPMAAAPADPDDDPAGSSSHNKGSGKDPKDKQPRRSCSTNHWIAKIASSTQLIYWRLHSSSKTTHRLSREGYLSTLVFAILR